MEVDPELEIPKQRCAPFRAALGVDPIGSAGAYDAFLCVEVPLPWERDISGNEPFSLLGSTVGPDGRVWRPQGLVPRGDLDGRTRVLSFERPEMGVARRYERREWSVEPSRSVALGRALIAADVAAVAEFDADRVDVAPAALDLFVCTHGRRDTCCGGLGQALHDQVAGLADESLRVWRVSHTGGHRFAPTALTFPDGYAWAQLDPTSVVHLVHRDVAPAALSHLCRGSSLLDGAPAQVADRAALVEVGWEWLDASRSATVTAFDRTTMATTVRIDGRLRDGSTPSFEVEVAIDAHVPQITCGAITGPEYTVEAVWRAVSVASA